MPREKSMMDFKRPSCRSDFHALRYTFRARPEVCKRLSPAIMWLDQLCLCL